MTRVGRQSIGQMRPEPTKRLAVVSCMDARVDPMRILEAAPGEIHVMRNAGGIVTDDVLRSLVLSQRKLGTRRILVMMHTDCGLLGLDDQRELDEIEAETGVRLPFPLGGFTDPESRVRSSVELIRSSGFLAHVEDLNGAVYDVARGRLRTVV